MAISTPSNIQIEMIVALTLFANLTKLVIFMLNFKIEFQFHGPDCAGSSHSLQFESFNDHSNKDQARK